MSILFLSKTTEWCKAAQRFILAHGHEVTIAEGERGTRFPDVAKSWRGDYVISFLSSWVVPQEALSHAKKAAINFHPGPPAYPGIGCYNFALYDQVDEYGVTCHHMASRVDTGAIIKVLSFPLFPNERVDTLKERSMAYLLTLFYEIASLVISARELPISNETWRRKPYTRKELDALCRITPDMCPNEVHRRVRATFYPGYPGPFIELAGYNFKL